MDLFDLYATIRINIDEFEHGINQAQKKFKDFSDSFKEISQAIQENPVTKGFEAVESVGKKAGDAIKKGFKGFAAASALVGGFGASATKVGAEFDSAMSQVGATMGFTVEELNDANSAAYKIFQQLRNNAIQQASVTSFSTKQTAEALNYMALAGYDAETSMAMLPKVLALAAAGNIDLARASDMITDSQTALSLSLDETGVMIDQMAKTASKSNTSVEQLGDAILTVGGTAKYLSGGTVELNTVLGILADVSEKGTEGGTKLRNIILSLASPTKNGAKVINELGVEIFDAEGKMRSFSQIFPELNAALSQLTEQQKIDALSQMFNTRDIAAVEGLLGATTDRWYELGDAILDSAGAAQIMADVQLDNLAGDVTKLKSAFEALQVTISDSLKPALREFAQFGTQAMQKLIEGFQGGGVSGFMSALTGIVTQGVTMLAQKAPEFTKVSMQFIDALATGILGAKDKIITAANESVSVILNGFNNWLSQNSASLYDFGMRIIDSIFNAFSQAGDVISKHIGQFVPLIANAFLSYHETLFTVGMNILGAIGEGISNSKDKIQELASSTISNIVTSLSENTPKIIDGGIALIQALVGAILENAYLVGETAVDIVSDLASSIGEAAPELIPAAVEAILKFEEGLTNPESLSNLIEGALKLIEGIIEGIEKALPILIEYAPTIIANLVTGLIAALPRLVAVGIDLVTGIAEGLLQGILALPAAIAKVVSAIIDGFKALFGIHSPSTVMAEIGMNLIEGLLQGISETWQSIVEFFRTAWEGIKEIFSEAAEWLGEKFQQAADLVRSAWESVVEFFSGIWSGIQEIYSAVSEWFSEKFRAAVEAVQSAWSEISAFFQEIWAGIQEVFASVAEFFREKFQSASEAVQTAWRVVSEFFSQLWSEIQAIFSQAEDVLGGYFRSAAEAVQSAWESAKEFFLEIWTNIKEKGKEAIESVGNAFKEAYSAAKSAWDGAVSFFSEKWTSIKNVFKDAMSHFTDIGKNIVNGIKDGLSSAWSSLVSSFQEKVKDLVKSAKSTLGIASPSKVFAGIGENMALGLENGWASEYSGIKSMIENGLNFGVGTFGLSANVNGNYANAGISSANASRGGDTYNFYSPKALDPVSAAREMKKAKQQMAMSYV